MEQEPLLTEKEVIDFSNLIKEEKPVLPRIKDLVELIGKFALGIIGLCYVLGLIIVNLYLSRYGIYSLSLFRLNYIIAGIWFLIPVILGMLIISTITALGYLNDTLRRFINNKIRIYEDEGNNQHFTIKRIGLFVVMSIYLSILIFFIVKRLGIGFNGQWFGALLLSILLIVPSLLWLLYLIYKSTSLLRLPGIYILTLCIGLALTYYIYVFATTIYETIPPYLGGGGTKTVMLLFKFEDKDEKDKKLFKSMGIEFVEDTNQTQPLNLLFSNEDEYIFLTDGLHQDEKSALSIKKDLIQAVIYITPHTTKPGGTPPKSESKPTTPPQTSEQSP